MRNVGGYAAYGQYELEKRLTDKEKNRFGVLELSIIKNKKKQAKHALSKGDIDFYKMSGVFAIVCVFVLLTLNMQSSQIERISSGKDLTYNFYQFCRTPMFFVLAILAAAGSICWFVFSKVKKIDESRRIFTSTNCLAIVLYLGFFTVCFGLRESSTNHGFFIGATIALAVLYYISKFYKADFVVYSLVTGVVAAAIQFWALLFELPYIIVKLVIIAAAAVAVVVFKNKISSLKVTQQTKSKFLVFPCFVVLALGTVFLFWRGVPALQNILFLNRNMMLAGLFVQYIVFAIVYTVRRIKD